MFQWFLCCKETGVLYELICESSIVRTA